METSVVLGEEYDEGLQRSVINVLKAMGAKHVDSGSEVAGSQNLQTMRFELNGHFIKLESETYIGLTVFGERSMVEELVRRLDV